MKQSTKQATTTEAPVRRLAPTKLVKVTGSVWAAYTDGKFIGIVDGNGGL